MRPVNYSEILYGSASLAGVQPADLDATQFALFRSYHDRRLQKGWEIHNWPDLCPIEKRYYRAVWVGATSYAATDERFDRPTGKYFQSLVAANLNNSPTIAGVENSAFWAECKNGYAANDWLTGTSYAVGAQVKDPLTGEYYQVHTAHVAGGTIDLTQMGLLTPFNRFIAYEQLGQSAIGEYFSATDRDPRITTQLTKFPFWLSQAGAQFYTPAPNFLWLYYRTRRPTLLGDFYDSTIVYASGQQVYWAAVSGGPGNFYTALEAIGLDESPANSPPKWAVVELPYCLRGYLLHAGYADWLLGNGQNDKATFQEGLATGYLEDEADKLQRQQQQVRRMTVH